MQKWRKIIICACAERRLLPAENLGRIKAAADAAGIPVEVKADCCYLAAKSPEELREITAVDSAVLVAACLPRAVQSLFAAAGAALPENILDLRSAPVTDEQLSAAGLPFPTDFAEFKFPSVPADWPAWFPAIDRKRCANCRKCADFCLFGVYVIDDLQQVIVKNPANCKNNCPACARICPFQAIVFPKSDIVPINGAKVEAEHVAKLKSELGDLRKLFEARKQQKRKLFRD